MLALRATTTRQRPCSPHSASPQYTRYASRAVIKRTGGGRRGLAVEPVRPRSTPASINEIQGYTALPSLFPTKLARDLFGEADYYPEGFQYRQALASVPRPPRDTAGVQPKPQPPPVVPSLDPRPIHKRRDAIKVLLESSTSPHAKGNGSQKKKFPDYEDIRRSLPRSAEQPPPPTPKPSAPQTSAEDESIISNLLGVLNQFNKPNPDEASFDITAGPPASGPQSVLARVLDYLKPGGPLGPTSIESASKDQPPPAPAKPSLAASQEPPPNELSAEVMADVINEANSILDQVEQSIGARLPGATTTAQTAPPPPVVQTSSELNIQASVEETFGIPKKGVLRSDLELTLAQSATAQFVTTFVPPKPAVVETITLPIAINDDAGKRIEARWELHDKINQAVAGGKHEAILHYAQEAVQTGVIPALEDLDQKGVLLNAYIAQNRAKEGLEVYRRMLAKFTEPNSNGQVAISGYVRGLGLALLCKQDHLSREELVAELRKEFDLAPRVEWSLDGIRVVLQYFIRNEVLPAEVPFVAEVFEKLRALTNMPELSFNNITGALTPRVALPRPTPVAAPPKLAFASTEVKGAAKKKSKVLKPPPPVKTLPPARPSLFTMPGAGEARKVPVAPATTPPTHPPLPQAQSPKEPQLPSQHKLAAESAPNPKGQAPLPKVQTPKPSHPPKAPRPPTKPSAPKQTPHELKSSKPPLPKAKTPPPPAKQAHTAPKAAVPPSSKPQAPHKPKPPSPSPQAQPTSKKPASMPAKTQAQPKAKSPAPPPKSKSPPQPSQAKSPPQPRLKGQLPPSKTKEQTTQPKVSSAQSKVLELTTVPRWWTK